ncbi:LysE family translocator [Streptomyces sp. NPDC005708]|uniref:LysE family translocator n=1 Tax=unclassified Streptomyces TaxID=2593676 RepID=UPI0033E55341
MIDLSALWGFALIVGLLTLTPGLDTALVLRTAALGHRRRAWGVVLGIQTGTLAWGVLTSLGVTALLTTSHLAYAVLRWVGAAYLLWMGGRLLWSTRHRADETADDEADRPRSGAPDTVFGGWRQGSVTNLLNPKVGAFYVAVLPQFIPAGASHLAMGVLLAGTHVLLGALWSSVLIACAHMLRDRLRRTSTRRLLDGITGTVIGAFGLRLALGD